jgi:hypothetical protein
MRRRTVSSSAAQLIADAIPAVSADPKIKTITHRRRWRAHVSRTTSHTEADLCARQG